MYSALEYLNNTCDYSSFFSNDRIFFEFDGYEISFDVTIDAEIDYDYFGINFSNSQFSDRLFELFQCIKSIDEVFISMTEFLGDRRGLSNEDRVTLSICKSLLLTVREINKISEDVIANYTLDINYGFDGLDIDYCGIGENYSFKIFLSPEYFGKIRIFKNLIKIFDSLDKFNVSHFYWNSYRENTSISESNISILTTNTKTRRIGYFVVLSKFLSNRGKVHREYINKKFEDFAVTYEAEFNSYSNPKGLIKQSKSGISAKPYIELSKDMDFLAELNNICFLGKSFKVYSVIRNKVEKANNVFVLDRMDRLYFLEQILKKDFFFTSLLLELIFLQENSNYSKIRDKFQHIIIRRLEELLIKHSQIDNLRAIKEMRRILKRVKGWEKPIKYVEHIIMPRINWYYDLGLLDMDKKLNIKLKDEGVRLFFNICYWNDLNVNWVYDANNFLNLFYMNIYNDVYQDSSNNLKLDEGKARVSEKISNYLNESFLYFKTLAPNRVTASQAITYAKYCLYLFDNIIVNQKDIEEYLHNREQRAYVYKFQSQYNDGYIQKK